jgi:hypothetical protein
VRAVALLTTLSTAALATAAWWRDAATARPELVELLGREQVLQIGAEYRRQYPDRVSAPAIEDGLLGANPSIPKTWRSPMLTRRIRDDFVNHRVVVVAGWVLSRTEARQCALYESRLAGERRTQ